MQLALSFTARARTRDPLTSHRAADNVHGPKLASRVLAELKANGPGTSHEIAARMNLSLVTVSPRLKPLADAGEVFRAGTRDGRTIWSAA